MGATVIIPVYNQLEQLLITLNAFNNQTKKGKDDLEVIVVDDGSEQQVSEIIKKFKFEFLIKVVRQSNGGRAKARNLGIENASKDIVIFCDADRVPRNDFVKKHIESHSSEEERLVIGDIREVYISNTKTLPDFFLQTVEKLDRRSRVPAYPRMISNLYDKEGKTDSFIPWIGTFTGNMSVSRKALNQVGRFDERFKQWGFEHFELGLRLFKDGVSFVRTESAINYHIAHTRNLQIMDQCLKESIDLMLEMHPGHKDIVNLADFMFGKKTLSEIESNSNARWLKEINNEIKFELGKL